MNNQSKYPPIARKFNQPTTYNTFELNPAWTTSESGRVPYTIVKTITV